jgi:hypothetical protein
VHFDAAFTRFDNLSGEAEFDMLDTFDDGVPG